MDAESGELRNDVSELELANALRAQGGALANDAEAIASTLYLEHFDTIASLADTEPAEVVEVLRDAGMKHTLKVAKRVMCALRAIVSERTVEPIGATVNPFFDAVEPPQATLMQETVLGAVLCADPEEQARLEEDIAEVFLQPKNNIPPPVQSSPTVAQNDSDETLSEDVPLAQPRAERSQVTASDLTRLVAQAQGRIKAGEELTGDITGRPKLQKVRQWAEKCSLTLTITEPLMASALQQLLTCRTWVNTALEVVYQGSDIANIAFGTLLRSSMTELVYEECVENSVLPQAKTHGLEMTQALLIAAVGLDRAERRQLENAVTRVNPVPAQTPEKVFEQFRELKKTIHECVGQGIIRPELGDNDMIYESVRRLVGKHTDLESEVLAAWNGAGSEQHKVDRMYQLVTKKAAKWAKAVDMSTPTTIKNLKQSKLKFIKPRLTVQQALQQAAEEPEASPLKQVRFASAFKPVQKGICHKFKFTGTCNDNNCPWKHSGQVNLVVGLKPEKMEDKDTGSVSLLDTVISQRNQIAMLKGNLSLPKYKRYISMNLVQNRPKYLARKVSQQTESAGRLTAGDRKSVKPIRTNVRYRNFRNFRDRVRARVHPNPKAGPVQTQNTEPSQLATSVERGLSDSSSEPASPQLVSSQLDSA